MIINVLLRLIARFGNLTKTQACIIHMGHCSYDFVKEKGTVQTGFAEKGWFAIANNIQLIQRLQQYQQNLHARYIRYFTAPRCNTLTTLLFSENKEIISISQVIKCYRWKISLEVFVGYKIVSKTHFDYWKSRLTMIEHVNYVVCWWINSNIFMKRGFIE